MSGRETQLSLQYGCTLGQFESRGFDVFQYTLLEKAMAPHSSTLAWKIPWTEEPGRLRPWGREKSDTTEWLHFPFSLSCIGEGNGNPLQCSCLENPRDSGAWWAAVYGVAQSQTQLKWLSSSNTLFINKNFKIWISLFFLEVGVGEEKPQEESNSKSDSLSE